MKKSGVFAVLALLLTFTSCGKQTTLSQIKPPTQYSGKVTFTQRSVAIPGKGSAVIDAVRTIPDGELTSVVVQVSNQTQASFIDYPKTSGQWNLGTPGVYKSQVTLTSTCAASPTPRIYNGKLLITIQGTEMDAIPVTITCPKSP